MWFVNIESKRIIIFTTLATFFLKACMHRLFKPLSHPFYLQRVYIRGLGYKLFIINHILYILVGRSHYYCIPINQNVSYLMRNKSVIYLFGTNRSELRKLIEQLVHLRRIFPYKEKGLARFPHWGYFIKKRVPIQK